MLGRSVMAGNVSPRPSELTAKPPSARTKAAITCRRDAAAAGEAGFFFSPIVVLLETHIRLSKRAGTMLNYIRDNIFLDVLPEIQNDGP
jgi:hypothetical protein